MNIYDISPLLVIGVFLLSSYYIGRLMLKVNLPAVIGFMLWGVALGPSVFNLVSRSAQEQLVFLTEITLGFVALTIGFELRMSTLRRLGMGIVSVICFESLFAFVAATALVYLVTFDWVFALIFGAMAPASAPAGTVAVIQENKAKGPLTQSLFAIVGLDDGLAIIIFGFAAAVAKSLIDTQTGGLLWHLWQPVKEVTLSIVAGGVLGFLYCFAVRPVKDNRDHLILSLGFILMANGIAHWFHLSMILVNMIIGFMATNTQPLRVIENISEPIKSVMPLMYLMFFALAGCNLELGALLSLGMIAIAYIIGRTGGKIFGVSFGARFGELPEVVKKHAGLAILSQAGVAIGLALIVKKDFAGLGKAVDEVAGKVIYEGDKLGGDVVTAITVTSIFFGIVGPLLAKRSLKRAGEISG